MKRRTREDLAELSALGVTVRYPAMRADKETALRALKVAELVRDAVRRKLDLSEGVSEG